jgi:hypothetical protein
VLNAFIIHVQLLHHHQKLLLLVNALNVHNFEEVFEVNVLEHNNIYITYIYTHTYNFTRDEVTCLRVPKKRGYVQYGFRP